MKALILSDLHLYFWHQQSELNNYKNIISKITSKDFDCVIICGDIFEYDFVGLSNNPYKLLSELLNVDCPIICCLGNHEYAYSTIDEVHSWFNSFTERYNVHILDIEGHYIYNGFNFVGNVFWYDNTLTSFAFAKPDNTGLTDFSSKPHPSAISLANHSPGLACKKATIAFCLSVFNIINVLL